MFCVFFLLLQKLQMRTWTHTLLNTKGTQKTSSKSENQTDDDASFDDHRPHSKHPDKMHHKDRDDGGSGGGDGNGSFLDLRTGHGQLLFLLISIALSVLIQSLPSGTLKSVFNQVSFASEHHHSAKSSEADATSIQQHDCNRTPIAVSAPIKRPSYWIYGRSGNEAHLRHVKNVLDRLGYEKVSNQTTDWDVLWAHDYPFRVLYPQLQQNLKPHQRINHFPGCGFITNKVDLATTESTYIPKAFRLPEDREKFIAYADQNPEKMFVQKHNQHRHINIRPVKEINYNDNDTFVQEYIGNPLLVDGHKFDMGVYVMIVSVNPLRAYIYKGDVLFRYCPQKYYPFDPNNVDKYIVGDDYLPVWDVPSLAPFYNGLGFGMKDSFDAYIRSKNRDPASIWEQVDDAIRETLLTKEKHIINAVKIYKMVFTSFFFRVALTFSICFCFSSYF